MNTEARRLLLDPGARPHLVGVCGAGMAPLALALRATSPRLTGEDAHWPAEVRGWLERGGVEPVASGVLPDEATVLVHSSAVGPSHPTRVAAAARGLPVLRRGEALAALVGDRPLLAVAGSHGKTTTTAMLVHALRRAGIPADHLLGGLFADGVTPPGRWLGQGPVIAEIDESDGTMPGFAPGILLCVNVDWDHCDLYRDAAAAEAAFAGLARRTRGAVFFNAGCETSRRLFEAGPGGAERFSFGVDGDYALVRTSDESGAGQTLALGGRFGEASARVAATGAFNALNAVGALAVAARLGAARPEALLADFPGVRRRQAVLPAREGVTVLEDYAHHPAEITALLRSLRARRPARLVAVFQPHRHSRTAQFRAGFARALALADRVFLLEVYSAGEAPTPGGHAADVLRELRALPDAPAADLLGDSALAPERLAAETREGDLLLFVGAGDIDGVARATAHWLRETPSAPGDQREALLRALGLRALEGRLSPETIVRAAEPLGPKTTIRVGGRADLYAEPADTADLRSLLVAARVAGAPVHLLGRGSNLIVPDEGVRGLVIRLQHAHWRRFTPLGPGRWWAGAGLRLKELCGIACRSGEGGFEFLEGIPGTVGGALRMNAGAMGGWIFDLVEQVHVLTLDGELRIRSRGEMGADYRRCAGLEEAIALGAVLRAGPAGATPAIRARMEAYQEKRYESQPREPSAGCIFKNPPGGSAGRLIDELGLKGLRIGDAEVSPLHGNFIVNRGNATGADVIALVRRIRETVRERSRVELEPEVLLYGREWREFL